MKLKSFFANSVEEAIRQARHELGPDAMLLNSKRTGMEAQHLGFYEVVVCAESQENRTKSSSFGPDRGQDANPNGAKQEPGIERGFGTAASPSIAALSPATSPAADRLSQDVSELKHRIEKLALTLARSGPGMASVAFDLELSQVFTTLTDAEFDTELAFDVVNRLNSPVSEAGVRAELANLVKFDSTLGLGGSSSNVVALIGPPGAGKTSALVKLAVQYGLAAGRTVRILTTDTFRIAAADELRSFAAILGIGCQVLEAPAALAQALSEIRQDPHHQKDIILIDTPGLCRFEMEACQDLAELLAAHPDVDTHLVLPASMRAADLRRVAERYSVFQPRKLLFTRLDETETLGPILSLSVRMGKPVSFFSGGQRIPEDLEPATAEFLLDRILGRLAVKAPRFDVVAA
jgi:flagellar biosynthesis protein FlhF